MIDDELRPDSAHRRDELCRIVAGPIVYWREMT